MASSAVAGLAGAGKTVAPVKKSLGEKLSDGINTVKALVKDEGEY